MSMPTAQAPTTMTCLRQRPSSWLWETMHTKVKINSTKSMMGHLLGAAGGVEFIACVKSIEDGFVHATAGLQNCRIRNVTWTMQWAAAFPWMWIVRSTNSLGFGGHNASLVVKKFEE